MNPLAVIANLADGAALLGGDNLLRIGQGREQGDNLLVLGGRLHTAVQAFRV
jgi:hypothetical protein